MSNSRYLRLHPLIRVLLYLAGNFCIIFLLQLLVTNFLSPDGTGFNLLMGLSVLRKTQLLFAVVVTLMFAFGFKEKSGVQRQGTVATHESLIIYFP